MPRPRIHRTVAAPPRAMIYKPAGIPLEGLHRVLLLPEELEALRLTDLEDLSQEAAAQRMSVSRSTFQRILSQARRQVALALCDGAALVIEGATIDRSPSHPRRPPPEEGVQTGGAPLAR